MKKQIDILFLLVFFATSVALLCHPHNEIEAAFLSFKKTITPQKTAVKKTFKIDPFSSLSLSNNFSVVLTPSDEEKIEIETHEDLFPYVEYKVKNEVLDISLEKDKKYKKIKTLNVNVYYKKLDDLLLSGECQLRSEKPVVSETISLSASGVSKVDIAIQTDVFDCTCSGVSKINIRGNADKTSFSISGVSNIETRNLKTDKHRIRLSGVSSCTVGPAQSINAVLSGVSKLHYPKEAKIILKNSDESEAIPY